MLAAYRRLRLAELGQGLEVAHELGVLLHEAPVKPRDLVVLAIGIIVATLRPTAFIPRQNHRHALAQHERRQHVLDLPRSQGRDFRVVGRSFHAIVRAVAMVIPVSILLAVGLVVLVTVAH